MTMSKQLFEEILTGYRGVSSRNRTNADFDFYKPRLSHTQQAGYPGEKTVGKFFTNSESNAESYGGKEVIKAKLEFDNPTYYDAEGEYWNDINYYGDVATTNDIAIEAYENGNDGVVIENVVDCGPFPGGETADTIVALDPNTIKSEETKLNEDTMTNIFETVLRESVADSFSGIPRVRALLQDALDNIEKAAKELKAEGHGDEYNRLADLYAEVKTFWAKV